MFLRYNLTLAFALCCAIGLYMLGNEQPALPSADQPTATKVAAAAVTKKGTKKSTEEQADSKVQNPEQEQSAPQAAEKVAFEPPFPDRTNLFQAPKRNGRGKVKLKGQNESAVELLGFVNVNGPRVALSIDGLVTTAAEGEKQYGIEVISIKPPAVLLQRGRQRWQATLEN